MSFNFFTLDKLKSYSLIKDVVIHPLKVNQDERGILVEIMKTSWKDVYEKERLPFTQTYYSVTQPGTARDEDCWHYHPSGQQDRFGVIKGEIVVAIFDWREASPTFGKLNLFHMGGLPDNKGQYLLLIPKRCLHGFVVVSKKPATLFNFPTRLYDTSEEERIPIDKVKLKDGSTFSWGRVRKEFGLPASS